MNPFRLVSPAGPVPPKTLEEGLAALAALDVPATWDDATLARERFLAGPDAARADALVAALEARPRGLWMTRGGWGSIRTLAALGTRLDDAPPAPLWGFSDGTALLAAWTARGWPAWHAPPIVQLPRLDELSLARVRAAVHADHVAPFEGLATLAPGDVEAPLTGGNLCVLTTLVGTPWAARLAGHVVVLEDTGEPAYKVDRMLTQLRLAGAFDGVAGFVFGAFTKVRDVEIAWITELATELARDLGVPAAWGLPVGHDTQNAPLPFGLGGGYRARLEATPDGARLAFPRVTGGAELRS